MTWRLRFSVSIFYVSFRKYASNRLFTRKSVSVEEKSFTSQPSVDHSLLNVFSMHWNFTSISHLHGKMQGNVCGIAHSMHTDCCIRDCCKNDVKYCGEIQNCYKNIALFDLLYRSSHRQSHHCSSTLSGMPELPRRYYLLLVVCNSLEVIIFMPPMLRLIAFAGSV